MLTPFSPLQPEMDPGASDFVVRLIEAYEAGHKGAAVYLAVLADRAWRHTRNEERGQMEEDFRELMAEWEGRHD